MKEIANVLLKEPGQPWRLALIDITNMECDSLKSIRQYEFSDYDGIDFVADPEGYCKGLSPNLITTDQFGSFPEVVYGDVIGYRFNIDKKNFNATSVLNEDLSLAEGLFHELSKNENEKALKFSHKIDKMHNLRADRRKKLSEDEWIRDAYWKEVYDIYGMDVKLAIENLFRHNPYRIYWDEALSQKELESFFKEDRTRGYIVDDSGCSLDMHIHLSWNKDDMKEIFEKTTEDKDLPFEDEKTYYSWYDTKDSDKPALLSFFYENKNRGCLVDDYGVTLLEWVRNEEQPK